jgi:hypothetical protein
MIMKTMLIDEADFIDFQLFGIASNFSDPAHFVFQINLHFESKFFRCEDLDVLIENQVSYYPIYEWEDCQTGVLYHIVKNAAYTLNPAENERSLSGLFDVAPPIIPQFRQYNYLLKVVDLEGLELPFQENTFIQKIVPLETENIKTINRLIF